MTGKLPTDDASMERKIRDAAERLFLGKGYALTSTTEIAKEAGCNQALVHYYFRTKDRLFEAVFAEKARCFIASILEISNEPIPFEEKIRRKISSHFDMLFENPQLPFLIITELVTNPERLESLKVAIASHIGAVYAQFERELEEEAKKGTIRPISVTDFLITMLSLNIMPFVGIPIMKAALNLDDEGIRSLLLKRREENVEIVLRNLRP
jgi:TetR/AcrR family transcriptional regulator